jgi:hypothetical protein
MQISNPYQPPSIEMFAVGQNGLSHAHAGGLKLMIQECLELITNGLNFVWRKPGRPE